MNYYGVKELVESFRIVRRNTILSAEDIPEEKYGYSVVPDSRTIEKALTHIALGHRFQYQVHAIEKRADFNGFDFSAIHAKMGIEEAKPRTKAQVIDLLKSEGEVWAGFVSGLSEAFLAEPFQMPAGAMPAAKSRFEMILSVKEHEMHHRGQVMLMQRALGIVPHLTRERQAQMRARG